MSSLAELSSFFITLGEYHDQDDLGESLIVKTMLTINAGKASRVLESQDNLQATCMYNN